MAELNQRNPHSLLNDDLVTEAMKKEFGDDVVFSSYEIIDFTNKGDNYSSVVTSVTCKGTKDGKEVEGKYVAKLNPCRSMDIIEETLNEMFEREGKCYSAVVPKFNEVLKPFGVSLNGFPECLCLHLASREEVLICKDLRENGFKMFDRIKGMGHEEAKLAFKAIAQFHAASFIFKKKSPISVDEAFPYITKDLIGDDSIFKGIFESMMASCIEQAIEMLNVFQEREHMISWLRNSKSDLLKSFFSFVREDTEKFWCIQHGDCWNNNMVFKYSTTEPNKPEEIVLLDLQLCRVGTVSIDLNYFLYSSFNGYDRKKNMDEYLELYWNEYQTLVTKSGLQMPFTLQELKDEQKRTILFGFTQGLMLVPVVLAENDEILDVEKATCDNFEEILKEWKKNNVKTMVKKPAFKSRFLSVFEELEELGIIKPATLT